MKLSVMLTLHDREPEVVLAVLRQLSRADLEDVEVIVVNDRSKLDYSWVRDYAAARFPALAWCSTGEYEAFRTEDGSNTPSRAFNRGLEHATGTNLMVLCSDTLVSPKIIERAKTLDMSEFVWTPMVVDLESGAQYCGPQRLFPAPWALCMTTERAKRVGGWDEAFLGGLCYEDNDFIGRVCLDAGRLVTDWTLCAWHISHRTFAYDMKVDAIKEANERNRVLCREKWGGIPFDPMIPAFDIIRKPFRTGDIAHECTSPSNPDLLRSAIEKTKSQFVNVVV